MSVFNNLFNKKKQSQRMNEIMDENLQVKDEEIEEEDEAETIQEEKTETSLEDPMTEEEYPIVEREIHPAKIICPDCGGITLEGLEFCDKCGGEL